MYKKILLLIAILLVSLLAYSFWQPAITPLTKEDAERIILSDLSSEIASGADVRIVETSGLDGRWSADVIVSFNPHSPCPTIERRVYTLMPIKHRPEMIISDCRTRTPITLREEALINSAKFESVKLVAGASDAYGCAFKVKDFDATTAFDYCPKLDGRIFEFVKGLPEEVWMIQWTSEKLNQTMFIALDPYNAVFKNA